MSPSFVAISYTSPADRGLPGQAGYLPGNPIIKIGLDITQSNVNLILVLFLVYIAVAIALRLGGEGSAKKMLTRLILVALLVNFAPLLVALVVDASNVLMDSILAGVGTGFSDFLTQFSTLGSGFATKLLRLPTFAGQMGLLAQSLVMIVLNIAIGLGLLLYAVIFIFRYIVIWLLVILSPLAFVSLIHPFTKKMAWDIWWKQLWEWSFIGAFMAFFLYLGSQTMSLIPSLYQQPITMYGFTPEVAGTFTQALPYFVVLIFLILGFTLGLQTSAMGANAVIGLTKRGGKWVGTKAGRGVKTWTEEKVRLRERVGQGVKMPLLSRIPYVRKIPGVGYIPGVQDIEKVKVARWFLPEAVRKYAERRPAIDEVQEKLSKFSSKEIAHRAAVGDIYGKDAVGGLIELINRGDAQDWFEAFGKKEFGDKWGKEKFEEDLCKLPEFRNKMDRYLQIALQGGRHNFALRGEPRLARFAPEAKIPGYTIDETQPDGTIKTRSMTEKEAVEKAVSETRGQHIKNWEREVLMDKDVMWAGMARGRDFWQSVKRGREEPLVTVSKIIQDRFVKSGKSDDDIWNDFEKAAKEEHGGQEGFFQFLKSTRAKEQGWTKERIMNLVMGRTKPLTTAAPSAAAPTTAAPPTAGAATGLPPRGRPGIGKAARRIRGRGGVGTP
jgi:hypothetical protein